MSSIGMTAIQATLMPSANGLVRSLTGTSLTNQMSKAGLYSGKSWTTGFQRAVSGLKVGALLAGSAATIAPAMVIKGGISRALNIEDAKAKLDGLGYDAQNVQSITEDVKNSVLGTRFALDQAVGAGVSALAAGVKKGPELTAYLKLITDAATISGTDMKEMGYIFNKINSNVYAYSRELGMMADRGIPIWSWLAEDMGVTVLEMRKMVADSKITSEDFQRVIAKNIGGAAIKSANTTRGALANMHAAYARLGEVLFKDTLPITRAFFMAQIRFADAMAKRVTPTLNAFWASAGPRGVTWMQDLGATLEKLAQGGYKLSERPLAKDLKNMKDALMGFSGVKPLIEGIGSVFLNESGHFKTFGEGMDTIYYALLPLGNAIQKLYDMMAPIAKVQLGQFFDAVAKDALVLRDNMISIAPMFKEFGGILLWSIGNVLQQIVPLLTAMMPVITGFATGFIVAFLRIGSALAPVLSVLLVKLVDFAVKGLGFLADHMPQILDFFMNWSPIAAIINGVTSALSGNKDGLSGFAKLVADIFTSVGPVFQKIMEIAGNVFTTLAPVFSTIATVVSQAVAVIAPYLGQLGGMFMDFFKQIASDNGPILVQIWDSLKNAFQQMAPSLTTLLGALGQFGVAVLQSLMIIIVKALPPLLEMLPPIIDLLGKLLPMFMDMVSAILPKIADALPFLIDSAMGFVKVLLDNLPTIIKDINSIFTPEVIDAVVYFTGLWAENLKNAMLLLGVLLKIAEVALKFTGLGGSNIADEIKKFIPGLPQAQAGNFSGGNSGEYMSGAEAAMSGSSGYFNSEWKPKKLYTGANIMGSRDGTTVALGDRYKAETVTDLGTTNDFISSTLRLVKQVGSNGGQPTIYSPTFHYKIENHTDLDGETIVRKIDEYQSNTSVYGGYNYNV